MLPNNINNLVGKVWSQMEWSKEKCKHNKWYLLHFNKDLLEVII